MITKEKGNVGEAMVLSEFVKRGIQCSIPYGDNARYDLIADFNNKLNRIQIKYCNHITENNSIMCRCTSSKNHTTNKSYTTYENDIDYFAFYLAPFNKCILVPIDDIGVNKAITVRFAPSRNNQNKKIRYIEDYSFDKILNNKML